MHSSLVRAQNVFGFFTTVAFCIGALIAASVLVSPRDPSASISVRSVQVVKGRPHYYSQKKEEYAHIRFDLDADFSSLFDWNTKQLFVYVLASYPSSTDATPARSESVIWDLIVPSSALLKPNPFTTFAAYVSSSLSAYTSGPAGKKDPKKKQPKQQPSRSTAKTTSAAEEVDTTAPGVLRLRNQKPKYQIADPTGKLAERGNVTLQVGWNVQPWVGALTWTQKGRWGRWSELQGGSSEPFAFPALKGSAAAEAKKVAEQREKEKGSAPQAGEASPVVPV